MGDVEKVANGGEEEEASSEEEGGGKKAHPAMLLQVPSFDLCVSLF